MTVHVHVHDHDQSPGPSSQPSWASSPALDWNCQVVFLHSALTLMVARDKDYDRNEKEAQERNEVTLEERGSIDRPFPVERSIV